MARRQAAATSWARRIMGRIVKERRAPGGTRTLVAALRVRYPRHWTTSACVSVGSEGLEPSPDGLRVRCAAANTLIPGCVGQSARRESNPRPDPFYEGCIANDRLPRIGGEARELAASASKGGLLLPLSYAPADRAGGTRTHTCRIKSPVCCRLHHGPVFGRAYAFQSCQHRSRSLFSNYIKW